MLVSAIKSAVRQKWTTTTFGTSDWDQLIPRAVRFYSRYNPRMATTEITTVQDQAEYSLPSGCILVTQALWYKVTEISSDLLAGSETLVLSRPEYRRNMPSDEVINDINDDAWLQPMRGTWEQWRGNGQLHLSPTPTVGGNTVYVTYTANHVETGTGVSATYATIPDEDLDIIADLVIAAHMESLAGQQAVEANWSLGQQRVTKHHVPENALMVAAQFRSGCLDKYGGVAAVAYP
jgi:hypothetical protein